MRFGGHETFHIREGWLHKGLKLLVEDKEKLIDEYSADWLGVGKNMAKSIRHWLLATGLAEPTLKINGKTNILSPTRLGNLIYKHDPYFLETGTLWILHVNLIHSQDHAFTWSWFFNYYNLPNFERPSCIDSLMRYIDQQNSRGSTIKTIQRDIACLLNTYSVVLPRETHDPEEAIECPFTELALMRHYKTSGRYQMNYGIKSIPFEVFCYNLSLMQPDAGDNDSISFRDVAMKPGGPGRCFSLSNEAHFDLINQYEAHHPKKIYISNLAGDRFISINSYSKDKWLDEYFDNVEAEVTDYAA